MEIGCPGDFDLVQANLDAVFSSLCRKLMCFNASKCKISRSPNKTLPTSEVELNGEVIERVKVFRFGCLGFRRSKLVPPHSENYKAC